MQSTSREETNMPGGKHLKGVGSKEERQYEHIKESAEKSGRYGKRAKEVAARTVMKHHSEEGHKKGEERLTSRNELKKLESGWCINPKMPTPASSRASAAKVPSSVT